jgi:hypothetical protein
MRWFTAFVLIFGLASMPNAHADEISATKWVGSPASALAVDDEYEWFGDGSETVLWRRDVTGARTRFEIHGIATRTQVLGHDLYYAFKSLGPTEAGGAALPYLGCVTHSGHTCRTIAFSPRLREVDDFVLASASSRAAVDSRWGYIVVDHVGKDRGSMRIAEPGVFRVVASRNGDFWFASSPLGMPDRLTRVDSRGTVTTLSVGPDAIVDMAACGPKAVAVALISPQGFSQIRTFGSAASRTSPFFKSQVFWLRSDGNQVIAVAGPTARHILLLRAHEGIATIASSKAFPYEDAAVHGKAAWMLTSDGGLTHAALPVGRGFCE